MVVSFGVDSLLDKEFEDAETVEVESWSIKRIDNKCLLKIIPFLPFSLLKNHYINSATKNFFLFSSIKSFEKYMESILSLMKSILTNNIGLKYTQTALIIENVQVLTDYFPSSEIEKYLCNLQLNHSEVYPLYLILNTHVPKTILQVYTYKATGMIKFRNCLNIAENTYRGIIEAWMINTARQYKEERAECTIKEGEIFIEEMKESKEIKKEEPLTTFKIGFTQEEEEDRKKIAGLFHTGIEDLKIEEDPEDDIDDDEGENF